jgi:hypothetical protein
VSEHNEDIPRAAKELGVTRPTVYRAYHNAKRKLKAWDMKQVRANKKKLNTEAPPTDSRGQVNIDTEGRAPARNRKTKPPADND